jgi:hypothetical protein
MKEMGGYFIAGSYFRGDSVIVCGGVVSNEDLFAKSSACS